MRNLSEISMILLIACFCFVKSLAPDEVSETRKFPLIDSYSLTIDDEGGFFLNCCEDIQNGNPNNLFYDCSTCNPATTSLEYKVQKNANLRSPKLNPFTTDIPPPHWYNYS